ncbi:hypothetical protein BASA81_002645 [Batrachochytrium salamandrivorans]|nr:hypothetical protein BASA81_002645 [Batrachochytrium salamandrivorans]
MLGASTAAQKVYINSSLKSGYVATSMTGRMSSGNKYQDVLEAINYETVPITEIFRTKAAVVILDSAKSAEDKEETLTRLYKKLVYKSVEKYNEDMESRFPELLEIDLSKFPDTERSATLFNNKADNLWNQLPSSIKAIKPEYVDTEEEEELGPVPKEGEKTIEADSDPKSNAEKELEEELPIKAGERLERELPFKKALTQLEIAKALEKYEEQEEEEQQQLYRGAPTYTEPLVPLNASAEERRKIGLMNDLVVDALDQYGYSPQLKVEVFEDILAGRYTVEDFVRDPQRVIDFYDIEDRHGDLEDEEVEVVDPTTTTATAAGNEVASEIDSEPSDAPIEQPYVQEQELVNQPFTKEISTGVRRYHPESLMMYFGSISNPDWDTELVESIKSLDITKEQIEWYSNTVVAKYGQKIFVKERKSSSREEMNELIQLQFCAMRNLNKGTRHKTANVKLSDLEKIKQAARASQQGPRIVTAPESGDENDAGNIAARQEPQITMSSEPVVFSVDEAEANFQRAFNNRKTDLEGRPLEIEGTLNHARHIQEGPLPTHNVFAPINYIDRKLTLRTRRKKIY